MHLLGADSEPAHLVEDLISGARGRDDDDRRDDRRVVRLKVNVFLKR